MRRRATLVLGALLLAGCDRNHRVLEGGEVRGLFFLDPRLGWVVGRQHQSKTVFIASTKDGGRRWETSKIEEKGGFGSFGGTLTGVAFRDPSLGRVFGTHALAFSTKDGGLTWVKEQAPGDASVYRYRDGIGCVVLGAPGFTHRDGFFTFQGDDVQAGRLNTRSAEGRLFHPYDVQIVNSQTLWGRGSAELYRSIDGGQTWRVIELDESRRGSTIVNEVRSSFFLSDSTGWIALLDRRILTTTDGGTTRTDLNPVGLEMAPGPLFFFDEQQGLMLVSDRVSGAVVVTKDGGRTWSKKVDLGPGEWGELFVLDGEHAWVAGTTEGNVVVRSFAPR